jgi:Domain of unknown function (DUF4129)
MLRRVTLLAVACATATCTGLVAAQTPPVPNLAGPDLDIPGYEAELDRCAESVKHQEEIRQLRQTLPRSWHVRMGEETVEVSTGWLASDLKKLADDPAHSASLSRDITSRLKAMRAAAVASDHGSGSTNLDEAHSRLDRILQGREFDAAKEPSQLEMLKARIARWIGEQIFKLLSRLHLGAKAGNTISWTIVCIAFLAFCYWVWKTVSSTKPKRELLTQVAAESNDPRQWAKDALAAAERGDYREAVHCAYWAAVVHLEVLGVLQRDRARTPRESLRLLDPHPKEQSLLREFTRRFELIWYGYHPASAQDWSEARSHLEKMGCLAPSTVATANS